jgi:type VI secretion system protein ImpG
MDPQFLKFYNRELQYIREMGGEFAQEFPKIAGRLGLETFECSDPYVERLLEGFAFLSARVQLKLDAEFPRFTQHLLEIVYPEYLCPTPSMAVVQFAPDLQEGSLVKGYTVPRGTALRSMLGKGDQTACEYRTAHDATLWPLELLQAEYFNREVVNIALPPRWQQAKAGVRLRLKTTAGVRFNELGLDRLTFFLRGGGHRSLALYEQIFADAQAVLIRPPSGGEWHHVVETKQIERVGFTDEEALLPVTAEAFQGYRLLHEYFAFSQRFMFFELGNLGPAVKRCTGDVLEVLILFDRVDSVLENVVDASNFALNCTPAINLFPHRADRIHLNEQEQEFHVVPDRTRPMDLEVYRIERVNGYAEDGPAPLHFRPFYSMSDPALESLETQTAYFTTHRMPRVLSSKQKRTGPRASYIGSEVYLSLVDGRQAPYSYDLSQLDVAILCTNRDLPLAMPVGKGTTDFTLETGAPVKAIRCVAGPTEPVPSHDFNSGSHVWRLINHLSLNYLSLVDGDSRQGATALREMLRLYADVFEADQRKQIDGLKSVQTKTITRRLPGSGPMTFGRGLEVTVTCDEAAYEGSGAFLFGAVLSRFFTQYVSLNAFTETVLRTVERGEIMRWPASIGKRQLL